jgi:hypothetical protein
VRCALEHGGVAPLIVTASDARQSRRRFRYAGLAVVLSVAQGSAAAAPAQTRSSDMRPGMNRTVSAIESGDRVYTWRTLIIDKSYFKGA